MRTLCVSCEYIMDWMSIHHAHTFSLCVIQDIKSTYQFVFMRLVENKELYIDIGITCTQAEFMIQLETLEL